MKKKSLANTLVTHTFLIVFTAMVIYPVLWVISMALTPQQGFSMSLVPDPTKWSLENFEYVVSTKSADGTWLFGRQLFNSLVVSAATTVGGIFLACTAAYAFSRFRFAGRRAGLLMFLVSQMFPGTLMLIPLYVILDAVGLLNQLLGLVLVYSTTAIPFCVWMLKGYFDTIPKDLEESAIIDGASPFTIFWRIILPLARPAIAVTALFSFMTAWNEFILATTFMSAETAYTLPVTLRNYVGEHSTYWGYFAAGAIIVSVPVMALFFVLQRHLVGGLTAGAVKG
jgi:arabinogalactan oligomer/maltooligosaccharide transport system permease protein